MRVLLLALTGLVTPGFPQALMRQRRAAWIAFGAMTIAFVLVCLTVWGVVPLLVVWLATMVDAGLRYRRLRPTIHWSWLDPLLVFAANVAFQFVIRGFFIEAFKAPSTSMNPTLAIGDHFFINKLRRAPARGDIITFQHPCEPERDYVKRVVALAGDTIEIRCSVVYVNGTAFARELVDPAATYQDYFEDYGFDGAHDGEWKTVECSRYRETIDGKTIEIFQDRALPAFEAARKAGTEAAGAPPIHKDFPAGEVLRGCGERFPGTAQAPGTIVVSGDPAGDACKPYLHYVVPADHVFVLGDNRDNSNDSRYWGSVPLANIKGTVTGIWYPPSRFGGID